MAYTGMCCWTGMVFVLSVLGYIITRDSDLNRVCKERTIRKLIGGGARARRSTNKVFSQEKIKWKKNSYTTNNPKNIYAKA